MGREEKPLKVTAISTEDYDYTFNTSCWKAVEEICQF